MRIKSVLLAACLALASCGGEQLEAESSALLSSQIWQSLTPVLQLGQPLYCGGYTYAFRIPIRQYTTGANQYSVGLHGQPPFPLNSSRGEFTIWCGADNAMTNFENALASSGPQVCYAYSHRAGETSWLYDGAVSMPTSGIYYAPKGSYNPRTQVYYAGGYWRMTFASYAAPPDGNGRVLSCFVSYGNVTVDLYASGP